LRPCEVADLGREPLERRSDEGEGRQQLRVAVARDHLCGSALVLEPEPLAGDALELRVSSRVRPNRAGELADAQTLERSAEPRGAAVELERPAGELDAERRRLRVDPMGAADDRRVAVLVGPL